MIVSYYGIIWDVLGRPNCSEAQNLKSTITIVDKFVIPGYDMCSAFYDSTVATNLLKLNWYARDHSNSLGVHMLDSRVIVRNQNLCVCTESSGGFWSHFKKLLGTSKLSKMSWS